MKFTELQKIMKSYYNFSQNLTTGTTFITVGGATGAGIYSTIGGVGLVGSFGGIGLGIMPLMGVGGVTNIWESGMVLRKGSGGRLGGMDQVIFLVHVFVLDLPNMFCSHSRSGWFSAMLSAYVWWGAGDGVGGVGGRTSFVCRVVYAS